MEEKIANIMIKDFNGCHCDTCEYENYVEMYCCNCHNNSNWVLSKKKACEVARKILKEVNINGE